MDSVDNFLFRWAKLIGQKNWKQSKTRTPKKMSGGKRKSSNRRRLASVTERPTSLHLFMYEEATSRLP